MKPITKQSDKKTAFTIIELLTVMSIIVILIGLLVPALNRARRYAKMVKQKAQFHSIGVALELFNAEFEGYPGSDEKDNATPTPQSYCGVMKLCEAMMGQDLLGFHTGSQFRADCTDGASYKLYDNPTGSIAPPIPPDNLQARRGPYLQLDNANAYKLKNIYGVNGVNGKGLLGFQNYKDLFVLCDVYTRIQLQPDSTDLRDKVSGKAGMPILYYKANPAGTQHIHYEPGPRGSRVIEPSGSSIDDPQNIYNYKDNDELVQLGIPWSTSGMAHLMAKGPQTTLHAAPLDQSDPMYFYSNIYDSQIGIREGRPRRSDSYILLSAGFDGEYGTEDDVFNFED